MKNAGFITLVLVTGMAVGTGAAFAKPGHGPRPTFEQLDADGSGEITAEEMQAGPKRKFEAADTDGDGALSLEELTASMRSDSEASAAKMLERMDKNGDSVLSAEELSKPGRRGDMLKRMDTDGSGGISKEEFAEAKSAMEERRKKWHHKMGHGKPEQTDSN